MTLEPIIIDGRPGTLAYLDANFQMVTADLATMAKVVFDDGSRVFYHVTPMRAAEQPRVPAGSPQGGEFASSGAYDTAESKQLHDAMLKTAKTIDSHSKAKRLDLASAVTRTKVKKAIVEDITDRLHVPEEDRAYTKKLVKGNVDLWAETSGDSVPRAVQMQRTVAAEFGLTEAQLDHMTPSTAARVVGMSTAEELQVSREVTPFNRAYVRAEYDATQAWFKKQGITHVSVYRGQSIDRTIKTNTEHEVQMQPASSWTTSKITAVGFASRNEFNTKDQRGMVLSASILVDRVLSTAVTGRGCLTESEIIVLGGKMSVKVGN